METTFIYALLDGENVRYIGKSNDPQRRFRAHLRDKCKSHKTNWITLLKEEGRLPKIEIIDEIPFNKWEFWEQFYISLYKSWGFDLINKNEGGIGTGVLNEEQKEKLSKIHKGKIISEETRKKISKARKGVKLTEEQKKNYGKKLRGYKQSDEHKEKRKIHRSHEMPQHVKEKLLVANIGRKFTEDHKNKISPLGRKHSEETKARIGFKSKERMNTEEGKEFMRNVQKLRWI